MPPRIPRLPIGLTRWLVASAAHDVTRAVRYIEYRQQRCLFCAARATPRTKRPPIRNDHRLGVRSQSHESATPRVSVSPLEARRQLRDALVGVQKQAGSYINTSQLNLALRGLDQPTGKETIRIAIIALADGGHSWKKAKQLVRAFIADPLSQHEEEWERALMNEDAGTKPLLFRIGEHEEDDIIQRNALLQEFHVPSPLLNANNLQILVLEMDPPLRDSQASFENAVLVPTMVIPTASSGRYIPITLPAHKSLVIADGILGAATLMSYRSDDVDQEAVFMAVDLPTGALATELDSPMPFHRLDIAKGDVGLQTFRKDVEKAIDYETAWYGSGVADALKWVQAGTSPTDGAMKEPVRNLIKSILDNARAAIQGDHSRQLSAALSAKISSTNLYSLRLGLSQWSERSHQELRDDLDIAFNGQRWRKLGWWQLFWRVDDVSMIASDILSQRFLTNAEKEVIFLSGRFQESGIFKDMGADLSNSNWAYRPVSEEGESGPPPPTWKELGDIPEDDVPTTTEPKPWPHEIPAIRTFLSLNTVPDLQALAQKLVLQTLSTSAFTSVLGGLIYISTLSTTLYEAGAVAAVGIVWSLKRMQGKWETARTFWEGEVREEGRKAVRGTEASLGSVLFPKDSPLVGAAELDVAQKAVEMAEAALQACK